MIKSDARFISLYRQVAELIKAKNIRQATVAIECYEAEALRNVELYTEVSARLGRTTKGQTQNEYYASKWAALREKV